MAPPNSAVVVNDPRDPQNVLRYVRPRPPEPETDITHFLCMPLLLGGVLLQMVSLFYVCLLLLLASWLACNYGEFNIQQYSSMGMLCLMGFVMPLLQQHHVRPVNSSTSSKGGGGGGLGSNNTSSHSAVKQPAGASPQ